MLDIMQFQGKPTIQTQKNGEKTHLGIDLGPLDPNSSRQFFFFFFQESGFVSRNISWSAIILFIIIKTDGVRFFLC